MGKVFSEVSIKRTFIGASLREGADARCLSVLPVEPAEILVAIVVSLVAHAHQVADPPVYVLGRKPGTKVFRPLSKERPEDETFPGLLQLKLEARVFFANAEHIADKIKHIIDQTKPRIIAFDLSSVPDFE
jgi:sulfate permease, SulP family